MAGGDGGDNMAAMCLVCGTSQTNLTQHLARHSKEEIIRAVTLGRYLPEFAERRGPGRQRRPSFPPLTVTTVPPVSSSTTVTSQASLLIPGNVPSQQSSVGAPAATVPQTSQPSNLSQTQTVKLSSMVPIIQPPRNGVPIGTSTASGQSGAPGNTGNYLLIGNNVFPAGGVLSNNLQLSNNGVGYLIPSSGSIVLAAGSSSNPTLLVPTGSVPTTTSQSVTVRQQTSPVSVTSASRVGSIHSNVAHQSTRPPLPNTSARFIDKSNNFAPERIPSSINNVRMVGNQGTSVSNNAGTTLYIRPVLPPNTGVLPQNTGILPQNTGVLPQNTGVLPQNTGVLPQNTGVLPQNIGVLPQNIRILSQNTGNIPQNTGNMPQNTGNMPQNSGNMPQSTGNLQKNTGSLLHNILTQKETINIGQNISITLPKDLVGQKDRLKEIINQELVRALLMNENQRNVTLQNQQPSTSGSQRLEIPVSMPTNGSQRLEIPVSMANSGSQRLEIPMQTSGPQRLQVQRLGMPMPNSGSQRLEIPVPMPTSGSQRLEVQMPTSGPQRLEIPMPTSGPQRLGIVPMPTNGPQRLGILPMSTSGSQRLEIAMPTSSQRLEIPMQANGPQRLEIPMATTKIEPTVNTGLSFNDSDMDVVRPECLDENPLSIDTDFCDDENDIDIDEDKDDYCETLQEEDPLATPTPVLNKCTPDNSISQANPGAPSSVRNINVESNLSNNFINQFNIPVNQPMEVVFNEKGHCSRTISDIPGSRSGMIIPNDKITYSMGTKAPSVSGSGFIQGSRLLEIKQSPMHTRNVNISSQGMIIPNDKIVYSAGTKTPSVTGSGFPEGSRLLEIKQSPMQKRDLNSSNPGMIIPNDKIVYSLGTKTPSFIGAGLPPPGGKKVLEIKQSLMHKRDINPSSQGMIIPIDKVTYSTGSKAPLATTSRYLEPKIIEIKPPQVPKDAASSSTLNISNGHSSGLNASQTSNSANHSKQTNRRGQDNLVGCDSEQQLFLGSDRNLNTILGDSALQEMVYVEEQVLGAVEEVFSGEHSPNLPSTSSAVNGTSNQKSQNRKVTNSYMNTFEHRQSSSPQVQENKAKVTENVKCETDPPVNSSQATSSSTNRIPHVTQVSSNNTVIRSAIHIGGKVEPSTHEQEEEMVDDPGLTNNLPESIFPDDQMFEKELSNHQAEELMSLKASETLADSDSERATPQEELTDLMFYDRSCMFAGEPGPANLSHPSMESSAFHSLAPAVITPIDNNVQIEPSQPMGSLMSNHTEVVNLNSSETTMHINTEIPPPEGLNITQLFPPVPQPQTDPLATDPLAPSTSASIENKVMMPDLMQGSKFTTKVTTLESSLSLTRQLSPIPSTSGLQQTTVIKKPAKEDDDYEFEYESDYFGDSDSDSNLVNRTGHMDLDHWKCLVCNKMFKSLKEKLLHAGKHSPCAEAMEKSGVIRSAIEVKLFETVSREDLEAETAFAILRCKEENGTLQQETRAILETFSTNGEYKCPECRLGFPSADSLFEHRKMVFKSRVTCPVCHVVFKKRLAKLKHMKTHTLSDMVCLVCNRNFPNRYSWSQHQLFHMGLVMFECKECGRRFQRKSELVVHIRTHTGERPYRCSTCTNGFSTRQALKRHLVTHMDGQEIDCDICQKTYKNVVCLNKHRLKAHSEKKGKLKIKRDFMCPTCHEIFHSERKLAWHKETHERWPKKCQHCGECFVHQSSLTKHIRHKHDPQYKTEDGKSENNATCDVCNKVFKKSSLALHLRTHTGDKPYQCNICNRSFAVKCNLDAHKWIHMGVRDRPHKCKMCERSFHRVKDLEAHIRSHKNIRPFTCNECGKAFIHKNNLQLHVKEHTGEKQHKCPFCGKAFFRKYNLDNHVRIHTGEMPYECTICRKDFTQKSNYNVHMKAFHVERHAVNEEL